MRPDELILLRLEAGTLKVDFSSGDVYGLENRWTKIPTKLLSPCINSQGYYLIGLSYHGVFKPIKRARIVWVTAHGLTPEDLVIDHINRDKLDDRLVNLRLVTDSINMLNHH